MKWAVWHFSCDERMRGFHPLKAPSLIEFKNVYFVTVVCACMCISSSPPLWIHFSMEKVAGRGKKPAYHLEKKGTRMQKQLKKASLFCKGFCSNTLRSDGFWQYVPPFPCPLHIPWGGGSWGPLNFWEFSACRQTHRTHLQCWTIASAERCVWGRAGWGRPRGP